jgi:hypothetical protein
MVRLAASAVHRTHRIPPPPSGQSTVQLGAGEAINQSRCSVTDGTEAATDSS